MNSARSSRSTKAGLAGQIELHHHARPPRPGASSSCGPQVSDDTLELRRIPFFLMTSRSATLRGRRTSRADVRVDEALESSGRYASGAHFERSSPTGEQIGERLANLAPCRMVFAQLARDRRTDPPTTKGRGLPGGARRSWGSSPTKEARRLKKKDARRLTDDGELDRPRRRVGRPPGDVLIVVDPGRQESTRQVN